MGRRKGGPRGEQSQHCNKGKGGRKVTNDSYLADNDGHFRSFKAQLAPIGLQLRDITGDGNCLFRALGDQLEGHSENHRHIRAEIVDYMAANREDFEPFSEDDVPFDRHLVKLKNPGTYGGQECIVAFARLHNVNVVVHQLDTPVYKIVGGPNASRDIHLAYHNYEHYSSVRAINDNSRAPTRLQLEKSTDCLQSTSSDSISTHAEAKATPEILEVMQKTGCEDENWVMQSLEENQFNVDLTCDQITSVLLTTQQSIDIEQIQTDQSANGAAENKTLIETEEKFTRPLAMPKGKQKTKHLTKRDKKELRRREKVQRYKEERLKIDDRLLANQENNISAEIITTHLSCLRV